MSLELIVAILSLALPLLIGAIGGVFRLFFMFEKMKVELTDVKKLKEEVATLKADISKVKKLEETVEATAVEVKSMNTMIQTFGNKLTEISTILRFAFGEKYKMQG